ncbi:hypothetical protein PIB30_046360 [Stylosanthes scabra]|uniref:Ribosomal protein S3 n=1 Tax=Stylosanthes scabra TaxID=79078 RepID=A0ABU6YGZ6_9FABA|nr:hypothetical protein [Stylosanthes scabra]
MGGDKRETTANQQGMNDVGGGGSSLSRSGLTDRFLTGSAVRERFLNFRFPHPSRAVTLAGSRSNRFNRPVRSGFRTLVSTFKHQLDRDYGRFTVKSVRPIGSIQAIGLIHRQAMLSSLIQTFGPKITSSVSAIYFTLSRAKPSEPSTGAGRLRIWVSNGAKTPDPLNFQKGGSS